MQKMEKICSDNECTGCGLCANICPANAIEMKEDDKFGHKRPVVIEKSCIGCGLCAKKCPVNYPIKMNKPLKCFAAWQRNDEKHYSSSSGGIAAALYEKALDRGASIVGVKIGKNLEPEFALSNQYHSILEFKGSKYVQPITGTIYNDALKALQNGAKVVFIGLPCQCAAMKRRAENIEHGKLILIDMVCHGIPAFHSLEEHIKKIEKKKRKRTTGIRFRDRRAGEMLMLTSDKGCFYKHFLHEDVFMHAFISGDLFADNCYRCRYAGAERVGDLTICDFWGIGKTIPFRHEISRVSAVLVNTPTGAETFEEIRDLIYCEERSLQEAIDGNMQLRRPSQMGTHRTELMGYAAENKLEEGLEKLYGKETNNLYKKRLIKDELKKPIKVVLNIIRK